MSHTSTIDTVVITDEHALRAAVHELKQNGIDCDLLENAIPRSYYGSKQEGLSAPATFVVRLNKSRYDVGLYPRQGMAGYEARADLFAGDVAKQLGVTPHAGENIEQAALGKLYNMYAVHQATRSAIAKGYRVQRTNNQDGSVQLQLRAA